MIRSLLMAAVAGQRSMTPLAVIALAARHGTLPDNGAVRFLAHPLVATGALALAAGEMLGDKLPSAPDRIIAPGLAARVVTGAIAGAALARRGERRDAAVLGAAVAVVAAYLGFGARVRAMRRFGQLSTGLVEDAVTLGSAAALVKAA